MATNFSKWIKYLFVLLAFALPFSVFTARAFAADTLYSTSSNGRDISTRINCRAFESGSTSGGSLEMRVGVASIDSIYLESITFDISYAQFSNGLVLNINYKPMTATYDNQTAVFPISAFESVSVSFYLPVRNSSDASYSDVYEWVTLIIGGNYGGSYTDLFLTTATSPAGVWDYWTSSSYLYHHFRIDTRYIDFSDGFIYTGSYTQYSGVQLLTYVAQTLESEIGYNPNILARTSFALDINYFPDALSFAEREQLLKLDQITGDLDELLNGGSGQFDDTKDQMQDASDKAEQGNQDIQDNAPKPDINDTVNDTSDVIDGALSGESFDKISDLLSAIFANTLISTILLISVAVGAVKYIFFGKG